MDYSYNYHSDDDDDEDETAAAAAADAIAESILRQMVSPHLGAVDAAVRPQRHREEEEDVVDEEEEDDPRAWLDRDDEDDTDDDDIYDDDDDDDYYARLPAASSAHRRRTATTTPAAAAAQEERAHTPVMSNAGKQQQAAARGGSLSSMAGAAAAAAAATPQVPFNVQSPFLSNLGGVPPTTPATTTTTTTTAPVVVRRSNPSRAGGSDHAAYRSHQTLLEQYVRQKRHCVAQLQIAQRQSALLLQQKREQTAVAAVVADRNLLDAERHNELDWLSNLNRLAWSSKSSSSSVLEGNFWKLLRNLRRVGVGLEALLWDDSPAALQRHAAQIQAHLRTVAARHVDDPPKTVLEKFYTAPDAPVALQRRQCIVQWLEQCFDHALPPDVTRVRRATPLPQQNDSRLAEQGMFATDQDAALLKSSLALLLAGRLDDACRLVRDSGVPQLAAQWSGGEPQGYTRDNNGNDNSNSNFKETGNRLRPLWRYTGRKLAERLHRENNVKDDDKKAIAALLSTHATVALDCASLRTWEKGLYVVTKCPLDRLEDLLLHWHNNHRRQCRPPYPGTQWERYERAHLAATSELADLMSETRAVEILESSPFAEMQRAGCVVTEAAAAFLVGQSRLQRWVFQSTQQGVENLTSTELRFLTHVALYLDSLLASPLEQAASQLTPPLLDAELFATWKNKLLLAYVHFLAKRDDLWYLVVFYATLLPRETLLEELPPLLVATESPQERETMEGQLREHLPAAVALNVLERTVQTACADYDRDGDGGDDRRKMHAVLWLCINERHRAAALAAANALLRQFYLGSQFSSAHVFLQNVFPEHILAEAGKTVVVSGDDDDDDDNVDDDYDKQAAMVVEQAQAEHAAFLAFHRQAVAVDAWEVTLAKVEPVAAVATATDKSNNLSATETAAALTLERRNLLADKRDAFQKVTAAADEAVTAIREVLEHEGGWLLTDDEPVVGDSEAEQSRRHELDQIRRKLLPQTALLYHDICVKTASWVALALNDTVEKYGDERLPAKDMLKHLDPGADDDSSSSSPMAPRFWTQKAFQIAEMTESSEFAVRKAFTAADYKLLLGRLVDTKVADLKYMASS